MVCDYLFCGTCFLNFRLSDITLFIEHKKNDCVANSRSTAGCDPSPSPDNLMANLLECVQCFRKFPTAWPLLMHVQVEHQLLFANAFRQASFTPREDRVPITCSEDRGLDLGHVSGTYRLSLDDEPVSNPLPVSNPIVGSNPTALTTPSSTVTHQITVGTQTNMSWFRSQSRLVRKRAPCCAPSLEADTPCTDRDCPAAARLCQCASSQPTDPLCPCQCMCSESALKTISCPPCATGADIQMHPFPEPSSIDCYSGPRPMNNLTQPGPSGPSCCMSANQLDCCSNGNSLVPSTVPSMGMSCCPCPPIKRAPMRSSEAQTDFDPEFSAPDYADIAMLLATPERDSVLYQPEVESLTSVVDPATWSETPAETNLDRDELVTTTDPPMPNEVTFTNPPVNPSDPSTIPSGSTSLPTPLAPNDSTTSCLIPTGKQVDWINATQQQQQQQHVAPVDEVMTLDTPYTMTASAALHISPHDVTSVAVTRSVTHQFVCSECGNQYRQKVHLRKHIMTQHTRQKPYRCPSCNYTTVEKSHLTVHVRTHTGERPFVCRECDYASAQNCTLKAHYIRKHLNSRIFCSKCQEPFYTELERANHERLCLGTRSYPASALTASILSSTSTTKSHGIKASGSPSRDLNHLL